jgi:hypothetical protein
VPYDYWRRPEIYVVYWLFFAVGFTEEGMAALHDLISTGEQDFNDPVFWFNYIILPVNTITLELSKMLPIITAITWRSPINRKAYQLWRYKAALSYIKIIVTFGTRGNLDKKHMNSKTQPYLNAMVSNKKFGRLRYETDTPDKKIKNNYVDGLMRAFLISFPEKFKEWAVGTIWRTTTKDPIPEDQQSCDTSDEPCDVRINPRAVWKAYKVNGVFDPHANYDIPSNWDAYKLFCLMNKGDPRMANFSTATLRRLATESEQGDSKDTPAKKRKERDKSAASYHHGYSTDPSKGGKWFVETDYL